ncbi:helix-turn-helix domain-containing protein [Alcaligenaceae bacterium]|nr:helix-turn-helix domain-containing protein [Alcaligenaceae bacterium]
MKGGFYISTDMVEQSIRDDFWRETSSLLYEISPIRDERGNGISGSVRSRLFGSMVLGNTTFNQQYCVRTPSLIAQTDLDFYLLQLIIAGDYRGDFAGRDLHVRPGDMFILDLARPLNSLKEAGARITLVIPRRDIGKTWAMRNLHGMVLRGNVPTNRLLADFIVSLDGLIDRMEPHAMPAVQESLMILVNAALSGLALTHEQCMSITLSMRQRIVEYIDRNLTDPELGPKALMRHFRLSHSHLYRAFESDKGVVRLIRDKRLDLAYRMILQKRGQPLSLKQLVYECGFSNRSQFSRFFQDRFGIAPKELRGLGESLPRGMDSSTILFHHYIAARVPSGDDMN